MRPMPRGLDGTGQTVAVIDTGINTTLAEFAGAIDPASTDIITERKGQALIDADGHGTVVASIIGARKNGVQTHGVAYNARIMAIRADAVPATGERLRASSSPKTSPTRPPTL